MIRLFSRSAAQGQFRTRSAHRDEAGDRALLQPIETAIEQAMASLQRQQEGLEFRVEDALGRASLTVGNDTYEHDTRDPARTAALKHFEKEIANARTRLAVVESHMANLRFVRAVFLSRFSNGTEAAQRVLAQQAMPPNGSSSA